MKEAKYWQGVKDAVHCFLCPHQCRIPPGETGRCGVRKNCDGDLFTLNYQEVSAIALDPIEKKPLYHFCPGSQILSVGSRGCNLDCGYCQNWASVKADSTRTITSRQLADLAEAVKDRGSCGVAFTYTEPLMWYEFIMDTAPLVRRLGLKTVLVSNGFIEIEPWQEMLKVIDAVNIDLKAFTPDFYRQHCGGRLQPVQAAIAEAVGKCHVEITTLLVEGYNTDSAEIRALSSFIADLDPDIPLHLSRYFPAHKWTQPATNPALIHELAQVARENLNYVYTGNLPESSQAQTRCPQCNHLLIQRGSAVRIDLEQGHCPCCKHPVDIQLCFEE